MNEKAFEDAYRLFVDNGYADGRSDFKKLLSENPQALNDSYKLFQQNGYADSIDDYKALLGIGVKEPSTWDNIVAYTKGFFGSDEEDVKKKAASTESSSAGSSLASPSKPKDEFQLAAARMRGEFIPPTGTLEEQAKSVAGQDSYMGMTVPKEKTYAGQQEVKKQFEQQQETFESKFNEDIKGTADFNRALSNINKEMMDFDEEDITPKLQGLFGLYGYKFDYATDAREAVEVTAPNGKKKTIPVDAFTEAGDIESANEFKAFINANKPTLRQTTEQPFYQDRNYNRILNEEEAKQQMANINKITERQDRLNSDLQSLSINKAKLAKELNGLVVGSPEYLKKEQQLNQLDNSIAETNKLIDYFNKQDKPLKEKLMASMGSYTRASAEQGGLLAASYNSALSATGGILAGLNDMVGFLSSRMMEDATPEEKDASYRMVKERSPIIRESLLKAYGITSVSEEYLAAAQKDFLKRNVLGAAAFVPQLAGMAAAPETAIPLFFLGGYDGAMEKMDNNPNFKKVSEEEKFAIATTSGVINTVLMRYNIGEKILETTAGKTLMGSILKGIGSKTGATTIEEVVDNEVKSALSRGLITAAAGAGHGFSLGAQIKAGEIASEELYNKMKEEKLFDTPETFTEAFHQVMESGLDMAMGSVLLGVPKTFQKSLKENNYEGITSDELEILNAYANSSEFLEFKKAQIGQKVASREITKEQGVQEIAALETNISIYKSIPENLSDAGKRKAMGLLSEKRQLDSFIQGKDKALVKKQIDRIAEINKQLEALPDMKEETPAPAEAPAAPEAQPAKPKTLDKIEEGEVRDFLLDELEYYEGRIKEHKEITKKAANRFPFLLRPLGKGAEKIDNYLSNRSKVKKIEQIKNNPEQYINDEIERYEKYKEEEGEDFEYQPYLDQLYDLQSKLQEQNAIQESATPTTLEKELREKLNYDYYEELLNSEYEWQREQAKEFLADPKAFFEKHIESAKFILKNNPNDIIAKNVLNDNTEKLKIFNEITNKYKENAIQEPTTEESVLRTEQPEVELPTMGEGNAQETTTQEGVAPAKPEEVKPTEALKDVESTTKALEEKDKTNWSDISKLSPLKSGSYKERSDLHEAISEAYHKAKADGSNPELVKAVEDLIGKPTEEGIPLEVKVDLASIIKTRLREEGVSQEERNKLTGTRENPIITSATKADYESLLKSYKESKQKQLADFEEGGKEEGKFIPEKGIYISSDVSFYDNKIKAVEDLIGKPTEAKPIEQELAELEQMFPETKTGENKGVAASDLNAMLEMHSRVADERAKNVIKTAYRLTKTLKSLFPTADIHIHETEESYNGAMEENNGEKGSSGNIKLGVDADGKPTVRIDIDVTKASALDVAHEVAHAVLQKAFGSNEKLFKSFQERIAKVISSDKNQALLDFANNPKYKEQGVTYEEYMAELKAILSQEGTKIELSTAKKIAAIINEFVSKITNGKFKPFQEVTDVKQLVDFVNKVTEAMAKGEAIDVEGAGKIGESSRASLRVGNNVEETAERLKEIVSSQGYVKTYYLTDNGLQIGDRDYKFNLMNEIFNKVGARKYALLVRKYIDPTFNKETLAYSNRPFADILKDELHSLSRDYNIDQIKDLAKAADVKIDLPAPSKDNIHISDSYKKDIAKAYHEGNNPSITKAVDVLLGNVISRSSLRTAEQVDKMVKDARASGYSERAIEEFLKKRGVDQSIIDKSLGKKEAGKKIITNEEMMPGYDKMMEDVNSEILRGLDRKTNETTIEKNVMKIVESSEAYKNATDQQKNEITREVKKAFGEKMKEAPSAEKITGKEDKTATENANKLKDQIKLEAKAAKEGASSVKTAIKKIRDFVVNNKETANLTRKDLLKVIDIMKSVKDEKSLEKATNKVLDIIDKANKDIIEVSKTKMDAAKMKAELKAAKDSAKGVVNKIKAVKAYFDSVQEYGNLTRKDLRRIMKEIASVKDEASLDKAVNNINDIIDKATSDKIEISEKKMIANTIKEVKLAKGNIKEKRKMIADVIDSIKKSGKLTASQVNALLKRANRLNVESFEHLNKFIEYTEKLFADADYDNKLSKGDGLRESIAKLSKNKGNKYNASLVALAEKFLSIKPSMVDDIDQYNKIASDLKDAVKGSSAKGFKSTVDIKAVDAYVDEMMTSQKEKLTEAMREQVNELLGVDGSTLTYEEMQKMLEKKKEDMSDEEEKIIRSAAIKLFDTLSSTINHILETGKDPFTGEDVDIKQSKKDVVKRFMEMDLTKMDIKDAIAAVDSLNNFIVNESTAKMEKVLSKYNTKRNMEMLIKNKITSSVLKIFRSKRIGRGLLSEFGSETILMDALFKGTGRASIVSKAMGLLDYKSNVAKAKAVVRNMVADYVTEFYEKEANGEAFNTSFNNIERGMLAFVSRLRIGKEEATFKDRKSLVDQSIKALKNGDEKEVEKANLYQEVYDKILKDSESLDDVKSKVDETNAKAVDFWIEKWAENYEELSDVSENIHNVILGKFGNYTPDVVRRVKEYVDNKINEEDMLDLEGSAFLHNSGIVQKKSGRLEKTTVEDKLPEGSYYDFGFDNNNSSLMSDALIDAKTAGNVIELSTFLNSPEFKKIVTTSEERNILKDVISTDVRAVRNKQKYNYDQVTKLAKAFNRVNALGASFALGGLAAFPKQYLPPAINTMIASGGNLPHFDAWRNKAKTEFIDKSGESIANRGIMSHADIKNIDNLLEEAAKSTPEKALRVIESINKVYLKKFLVNADVAIARASWLTYYEKGLRKQGLDSKNIDYSKHELNKEAAQYATRMVDRQQNISDEDFRGKFYSRTEGLGPIVNKVLLPFASFRINQWLRMNTDLGVLTNKTATKEDRKAALLSLSAVGPEIIFFNLIGLGISSGLHSGFTSLKRAITGTGDDEDKEKLKEQDEKYWKNLLKSKGTSLVQDFLSPLPPLDPAFETIVYNLLDKLQSDKKEKDRINIFDPKPTEVESWLDYLATHTGGAGILIDRVNKFKEIASAYMNEKIETTAYGETTEKNIRERDKKILGGLTILGFINTFGLLPTEAYNAQNTAFKEIKKEASTKTEAEIIQAKAKKREQRADNIQKIQIINQAINEAQDQNVINELMKMKRETRMKLFPDKISDEAKEVLKEKRKRERASYQHLLGGYDTKEDLKRYNPDLYEQNFGEGSNYYATHEAESKAEKLYDKVKKQYKDDLYNYTPPPKKKKHKKKKNSDGSYKRSSYSYSYSSH